MIRIFNFNLLKIYFWKTKLSVLTICSLVFSLSISAQVIVEETNYDLGEVDVNDGKFHDFKLTNASSTVIKIIDQDIPYGVGLKFSRKSIAPDSSILVRVKYTPKRKGEFNVDVPIWLSSNNEPISLTLKGKANSYDIEESLDPPDFTSAAVKNGNQILIKVIDRSTGEPIPGAFIDIIWDGVIYQRVKSNDKGMVSKRMKDDYYYFVASADGYSNEEKDYELSGEGGMLIIEMGEGTGEIIAMIDTPDVQEPAQALQDELPEDTTVIEDTTEAYVVEEPDTAIVEEEIVVTSEDLPEDRYSPNNIVFLIDVSVSMRGQGKLDLLKASMIELAGLLRPTDKVAIVTYSSQTNVVLHSTSASNHSEIIQVIKNLEAGGKTAGTKGIKRAYKVLNNNKIEGGNNQIFISTDGAFNLEKRDKKLLKIVKKNARKGNKISVIGIKNKKWTVPNMLEIANKGNGSYLHIESYDTAKSSLIEEVKKQSVRN